MLESRRLRPAPARGRISDLLADVFEVLPSGVIVVDGDRRLLAANRTAHELLGDQIPSAFEEACCQIFGCGEENGPLGDACITELATSSELPLPEVRIDLPPDNPSGAVWVIASPLSATSSCVVFQIRKGDRGDRRRRTDPHWLGERQLTLRLLGGTRVESAEGNIGGAWLQQRAGQLLKYLVTERGRPIPAEQVAAALWPTGGLTALNSVRHYIHVLRQKLEPDRTSWSESSFLLAQPNGYMLNPLRVSMDADLFEQRVRTGMATYVSGDEATAVGSLEEALDLYRGDFVADEPYAEWALEERDRLRDLAGRACRMLTEYAYESGDLDFAARYGDRLADLEPFDAEVQRAVLTIALRRGRLSEAARRYGTMRQRMTREFGQDLPFALSDLNKDDGQLHLL